MQGTYDPGDADLDEPLYDVGDDARKYQAEVDAWDDGLVEWPDLGEGPCW